MRQSRLEVAANIAIIVAASVVVLKFSGVLGPRTPPPAARAQLAQYVAGQRLPALEGLDLQRADKTLLLILHDACKYCSEGMPFFRDVVNKRRKSHTQVVVASRNTSDDLAAYLAKNNLVADAQITIGSADDKMKATPTLLLVDRSGTVERVWVGLPGDDGKLEVLHAIE